MDKILFLISAFLLVWGLRLQSDPSSASKGNKLAGIGMLLAIFSAIIAFWFGNRAMSKARSHISSKKG